MCLYFEDKTTVIMIAAMSLTNRIEINNRCKGSRYKRKLYENANHAFWQVGQKSDVKGHGTHTVSVCHKSLNFVYFLGFQSQKFNSEYPKTRVFCNDGNDLPSSKRNPHQIHQIHAVCWTGFARQSAMGNNTQPHQPKWKYRLLSRRRDNWNRQIHFKITPS